MYGIKTKEHNEVLDFVTSGPIWEVAELLDLMGEEPWTNNELPPLGHWLFCHGEPQNEEEPYLLAGGDILLHKPISYGSFISRISEIDSVREKPGRSGRLSFRTVQHRILSEEQCFISEAEDWVAVSPWSAQLSVLERPDLSQNKKYDWEREITITPRMQIGICGLLDDGAPWHIYREYCQKIANYPGLLVHGRMSGILLMDLYQRNNPLHRIKRFTYRITAPTFDKQILRMRGQKAENGAYLWAENASGRVVVHARILAESQNG
jgi:3-methylfumaryl-CoA hydratase